MGYLVLTGTYLLPMGNIPGMYPVSTKYVLVIQGLFELIINLLKCVFLSNCCIYEELSGTKKRVRNTDVNCDSPDPFIPSTICHPMIRLNQTRDVQMGSGSGLA